jgi:DDE family transposase
MNNPVRHGCCPCRASISIVADLGESVIFSKPEVVTPEALSGQQLAANLGRYEKERTGRELLQRRPAMAPLETAAESAGHDFPQPEVPRAYPYGIYDIGRNTGFVNVGTDHDTGAFAVASIRGWWRHEGKRLYPKARNLLITADAGGSNGWRLRLWKVELQKFADEFGLTLSVCHFPPGTSKWNKVEHRLFSFISSNWRGEPLRDYETIVNLIAQTTTAKGLTVICRLDRRKYPTGRKITAEQMKQVNLHPDKFHGQWNYVIKPRCTQSSPNS